MKCQCGQHLHYTNQAVKKIVDELVAAKGEYVAVTWHGRSWWVSRHYVALHGIKGKELPTLGFTEAPPPQ